MTIPCVLGDYWHQYCIALGLTMCNDAPKTLYSGQNQSTSVSDLGQTGLGYSVSSGFTLIELMIVVTIIGILAAIAIPSYEDYVVRAKLTEGFSLAAAAETAVSDTYQTDGYFPAGSNTTYGLALSSSFNGHYVSALSVLSQSVGGSNTSAGTPPVITVQYRADLGGFPTASGTVLTFTATPAIGAISWACGYGSLTINGTTYTSSGTTVPAIYLPPNCR